MSPRRKVPLAEYDVYFWPRNAKKAKPTGEQLGSDKLPATWKHDSKTGFWAATDDIDHLVIFSEIDPRTARSV